MHAGVRKNDGPSAVRERCGGAGPSIPRKLRITVCVYLSWRECPGPLGCLTFSIQKRRLEPRGGGIGDEERDVDVSAPLGRHNQDRCMDDVLPGNRLHQRRIRTLDKGELESRQERLRVENRIKIPLEERWAGRVLEGCRVHGLKRGAAVYREEVALCGERVAMRDGALTDNRGSQP